MFNFPGALLLNYALQVIGVVALIGLVIGLVVMWKGGRGEISSCAEDIVIMDESFKSPHPVNAYLTILVAQPVRLRVAMDVGASYSRFGKVLLDELGECDFLLAPRPSAVIQRDEAVVGIANECSLKKLMLVGQLTDGRVVFCKTTQLGLNRVTDRPPASARDMDECHA